MTGISVIDPKYSDNQVALAIKLLGMKNPKIKVRQIAALTGMKLIHVKWLKTIHQRIKRLEIKAGKKKVQKRD